MPLATGFSHVRVVACIKAVPLHLMNEKGKPTFQQHFAVSLSLVSAAAGQSTSAKVSSKNPLN